MSTTEMIVTTGICVFFGLIILTVLYLEIQSFRDNSKEAKNKRLNREALQENPRLKEVKTIEIDGLISKKFMDQEYGYSFEVETIYNGTEMAFDYKIGKEQIHLLPLDIGDKVLLRIVETAPELENGEPQLDTIDYFLWQVKAM